MVQRKHVLALAGAFAVMPARARAQSGGVLRVATVGVENGAEAFYADELGFFKAAGMKVEIQTFGNGGAVTAAVASQAASVGFSNLFSVVAAFSKGIPLKVVAPAALALVTNPTVAVIVSRDGPLRTIKDLAGKTIGCDGLGTITQVTVQAWLDANGVDPKTAKFVEVPGPLMSQALQQKRVDACSCAFSDNPAAGTPESTERVIGYPYEAIAPRFLASGYIASSAWLASNADEAKKFAGVITQTAKWANAHPEESGRMLTRFTRITLDQVRALGKHRPTYSETFDPALIDPVVAFAAKYNLIAKPFDTRDLVFRG
jgi:NitT/TauT family transport system substrate-binding protein